MDEWLVPKFVIGGHQTRGTFLPVGNKITSAWCGAASTAALDQHLPRPALPGAVDELAIITLATDQEMSVNQIWEWFVETNTGPS